MRSLASLPIVLAGAVATSFLAGDHAGAGSSKPRKIKVTAYSNRFAPNRFNLKVGQPVEFIVHSTDTFHTFTVKKSKDAEEDLFSIDLQPGETKSHAFTATEPGTLYVYCKYHQAMGMEATIVVKR